MNKLLLLILASAALTFCSVLFGGKGLFVLDNNDVTINRDPVRYRDLVGESIISAKFISNNSHLSSISLKFDSNNQIKLRLKAEGEKDWYYSTILAVAQKRPDGFYKVDFSPIKDSSNAGYLLELEVVDSNGKNGEAIYNTLKINTEYKFPRGIVLSEKKVFANLIKQKIDLAINDAEFWYKAYSYFLPAAIYLFFKLFSSSYPILSILLLFVIVFDIFQVRQTPDFQIIIVSAAWVFLVIKHKLDSRIILFFSLIVISFAPLMTIWGNVIGAEKSASWAVVLLAIALILQLLETNHGRVDSVQLSESWTNYRKLITQFIKFVRECTSVFTAAIFESIGTGFHSSNKTVGEFTSASTTSIAEFVGKSFHFSKKAVELIIRILKFLPLAVPIVILVLIVRDVLGELTGQINFYLDFFPEKQLLHYFEKTGIYVLVLLLAIAAITTLLTKRLKKLPIIIIMIAMAFLFLQVEIAIFNATTKYKYGIVIHNVRGLGLNEPWADIFISGRNFGDKPFVGKVTIDGIEQRIMDWTDWEITFRSNPTITKSGNLVVTTKDGKESQPYKFLYHGDR